MPGRRRLILRNGWRRTWTSRTSLTTKPTKRNTPKSTAMPQTELPGFGGSDGCPGLVTIHIFSYFVPVPQLKYNFYGPWSYPWHCLCSTEARSVNAALSLSAEHAERASFWKEKSYHYHEKANRKFLYLSRPSDAKPWGKAGLTILEHTRDPQVVPGSG